MAERLDAVEAVEVELVAEEARIHEIEQRPELAEMILDRRSRQAQPMRRIDRAVGGNEPADGRPRHGVRP